MYHEIKWKNNNNIQINGIAIWLYCVCMYVEHNLLTSPNLEKKQWEFTGKNWQKVHICQGDIICQSWHLIFLKFHTWNAKVDSWRGYWQGHDPHTRMLAREMFGPVCGIVIFIVTVLYQCNSLFFWIIYKYTNLKMTKKIVSKQIIYAVYI